MDSMRGDDSSNEKYPQSLDHSNKDIPISDKRMTRTNFEPRPELENVGTAKRARTPDDPQGVAGSVKRLATLTEGRSPSTLVGKAATRGSQRSITKQGLKGLELVKAAKEGRSVTSRPICSGSPWERYIKRYELNLDDHIYIVSDKSTLDTFMIKCLKGLDAEKKVAMLERVQHKSFLPMLECFNFENSYYPVFPHIAMPLSQIIHSPPYPTELELTAVLGQVRSPYSVGWALLTGLDPQWSSVSRLTQAGARLLEQLQHLYRYRWEYHYRLAQTFPLERL